MKHLVIDKGSAYPLGMNRYAEGINFSLFSAAATQVILHLFTPGSLKSSYQIVFDPQKNKTGSVWHIFIKNLKMDIEWEYGYQLNGDNKDPKNHFCPDIILLDPYSKCINTHNQWGVKQKPLRGKIQSFSEFDWEQDTPPKIPMEKLIIYEMHVRSFTQHPSSASKKPGTFSAIKNKIPYLKELGINAIELMPIFEFDECELHRNQPVTKQPLYNVWGYSTCNFFSLMNRYSQEATRSSSEFKDLVKALHKEGIEVILDVVYNHTAEGGTGDSCFSFAGIDNSAYYMLTPNAEYLNFSGTGNTLNINNPVVTELIIHSLRYWVTEMHVDGFRFDLASCFTRDEEGSLLTNPLSIHAITKDPILSHVKLIAEPWDAVGLYQVGAFPNGWAEWNGKYRDAIRRFIKGTEDTVGEFASAICGSEDLYGNCKSPYHSINFVTSHDGFTLHDLVSYQKKHNLANGEENHDGSFNNDSWNCGVEGETDDPEILFLRQKQMRNLLVALLVSLGTPMLLMGDEYAHTRFGNNNAYCQDNELNWFLWDKLKGNQMFTRFYKLMISFRKTHGNLLQRSSFLTPADIEWHGYQPLEPNWGSESRFISYTLKSENNEDLYIAFNAHFASASIELPAAPAGKKWYRIVDTSLNSPKEFCEHFQESDALMSYTMSSYSSFIAKSLELN